jgi:NAD(P)-dependent dehydrogenase (short-subunit alcohol dehydrogenase family)
LNARDDSDLNQTISEIKKITKGNNNHISFIAGDICQEKTCKALIDEAINRFGRIDVLVNNVGISGTSKKISEVTLNDWNEVIDVYLKGAFLCTKGALKHMFGKKRPIMVKTIFYY